MLRLKKIEIDLEKTEISCLKTLAALSNLTNLL